ncbi:mannosyltransferase putative-domain-containing protein [Bisporella sp. PMI_857]|nr:mannosyltransferase putative-domain-containing protein [Bisporella sp. PMI_857]
MRYSNRLEMPDHCKEDILDSKLAHSVLLKLLPTTSIPYRKHSQGAVIVGGGRYTATAIFSVLMIRKQNPELPVEVFLPTRDDYDHYTCEVMFKSLNARCLVISDFTNIQIARYQYKIFSIIFSSFENVVFLDADSIPLIDVSELFRQEPYISTGLITWPDFWASTASHLFYNISDQKVPPVTEHASSESGQMLISKSKHANSLLLALYYNIYGPPFFYRLLSQNGPGEGDKETWVAAAKALNLPYYQVRERAQVVGHFTDGSFVFSGIAQHHPGLDYQLEIKNQTTYRDTKNAKVVFLHLNGAKPNPVDWLNHAKDVRMWGPRQDTIARFGYDLEGDVWNTITLVACQYNRTVKAPGHSSSLCHEMRMKWDQIRG